ncbi:MAG: DUF1565 domain-containing protein, partial [Methanobrevibacter sp.]|nr:DUF1565 domain-containing protein [Methanobrevibacter sp.]
MKNSKIILVLSIFLMLFLIIPSSFAGDVGTDLDDSIQVNQDSAIDLEISSSDSSSAPVSDEIADSVSNASSDLIAEDIDDSFMESDLNMEKSHSNSLADDVNEGFVLDYDTVTMVTPKSAYINGTLYFIGPRAGEPFMGALNISYSYVGDDGNTYGETFVLGSQGRFSVDLTFLSHLSPRDDPYIFTISCPDDRFIRYWDNTQMPDPVTATVYVEQGTAPPVVNNSIYVATDGDDLDGSGHIDAPLFTIQRAMELAAQMKQNCTIYLKEGVYEVDYKVNNSYKYDLNITGLGDVTIDLCHGSNAFELSGTVHVSNLTFYNGYAPRLENYAPLKMSSTSGKLLSVDNCNFINCTGYASGGVSTYYGGTAVLKVTNSKFINCKGTNGAAIAVSYAKFADISHCSFINCSSTYGAVGIHTTTGGMNKTKVNYCVFLNCQGTNVSGVFTKKAENLDYNFWGINTKPNETVVSPNSTINYWVPLNITADLNRVVINTDYDFDFDLTRYTDGTNFYDLDTLLPDIEISMTTDKGAFQDNPINTVDGRASTTYSSSQTGSETLKFYTPQLTEEFSFDILGDESNVIYVATNGSDSGRGTESSPYRTIEHALEQVTDTKNTIYIRKGTYNEHDLTIDETVTIIGEDLDETIIDAEGNGRIFAIYAYGENVEIKDITLINGCPDYDMDDFMVAGKGGAIYLDEGNLKLNRTIISNSKAAAGGAVASIPLKTKITISRYFHAEMVL